MGSKKRRRRWLAIRKAIVGKINIKKKGGGVGYSFKRYRRGGQKPITKGMEWVLANEGGGGVKKFRLTLHISSLQKPSGKKVSR